MPESLATIPSDWAREYIRDRQGLTIQRITFATRLRNTLPSTSRATYWGIRSPAREGCSSISVAMGGYWLLLPEPLGGEGCKLTVPVPL